MTLPEFRDLLLTVCPQVFHYEAAKAESDYIVWHEAGTLSLMGDGESAESGTRIAVDFFTKDEYSPVQARLELVLGDHDEICLTDYAIDFEKDTGLIHHAMTCEVM